MPERADRLPGTLLTADDDLTREFESRLRRSRLWRRGPEVLIAGEESAALRRLMHRVRHGMVEPADVEPAVTEVQAGGPPSAVLVLPMPAIPPVAIAQILAGSGKQAAGS